MMKLPSANYAINTGDIGRRNHYCMRQAFAKIATPVFF